ncbi:EAL domain-containing protein [Rhizobiaceae bacterium BDR2-2]|uniref:EAL domain-containing protein n=1 Tax=Ectorhizobium quercum TaxID=2965071 RepID=A0AAE3N186_9HYPH|nr:GGDEF and EAL domain-containing protein [Ectorhizobium quercum]MCX8997814.1 EAL domain-containing protein [Ectorhizobium quercum]
MEAGLHTTTIFAALENTSSESRMPAQADDLACLPFAAALLASDGNIVASNALFRQEWCAAAPGAANIAEIVADEDLSLFAAAIVAFMRNEASGPATLELRFSTAPAGLRKGLAALVPHAETGVGRPLFLLQIAALDVQSAREEALAALEERWRNALTASKLGVWDHDLRSNVFNFSDLWLQIRGVTSPDEVIHNHSSWIEQIHPDDREATRHAVERQNRGDPDYSVVRYRVRHKDGHWIWIECRGMCVEWDENGNPARTTGTDADVTSRKDWEDNMTAMSQRLHLALEVSRIGVFEANFANGETTWDDRMYSIYGVPPGTEIRVGTVWESMLHPQDRERVFRKVNQHLDSLLPFFDEFRIVRKDGSIGHIRSRALPFVDPVTGRGKIIGANWDVSEDVEMQKQLRQARDLAEARNAELEAARASIEYNALHDHLTGLPNRRYLDRILDDAGENGDLSILHIDLDRFKQINDTQGHSVGDAMLRHVAGVLARCVDTDDFIARIGGDEFVVIAQTANRHRNLVSLASRIIDELRKPVTVDGHTCRIGASIGIASRRETGQDAHALLQNADIALYHAKNRGRNRYEVFSSCMQEEIVNAKKLSDEILRALDHNEFVPYYQFQFDARTLDICGAETLARWQHPEHGILTPDRFLSIAEDLDAVSTIDARILERALADFRDWERAGLGIPKVSVNVSARRLHDPALHHTVRQLGIKPATVAFELLESVFLDNFDTVVADNLRNLKELGIDIEIDDFGSGHASIVSLVKLSPATLKIDRELIMPLQDSPEQRRLVGSIIDIGRSLNIRVVAEGVETARHIRILRDLGCDALQGYALARPMPATAIAGFIGSARWRTADRD